MSFENKDKNIVFYKKNPSINKQLIYSLTITIPILIIQLFLSLNILLSVIFIIINISLIGFFADHLLNSARKLAIKLKISGFIIGLVLIPAIASLPEIIILIFSNLENREIGSVMLAQTLGNNLFELLVIFGISGFLACKFGKECVSVKNKKEKILVLRNGIILILSSLLITLLIVFDRNLSFVDSCILVLFYIMFLSILYFSKLDEIHYDEDIEKINGHKEFAYFLLFLGLIIILSHFFVSEILYLFERSENFEKFAFIYIGIAVAIPDLIIAIIGFFKEKKEEALGFVIGSAIWDMIMNIAIQGLINPVYNIPSTVILFFLIVTIICSFIAVIYIRTNWQLKLWEAVSLISFYFIIIIAVVLLI